METPRITSCATVFSRIAGATRAVSGFEHPFLIDPAKRDWFAAPTEYGARRWKVENPAVADYLIGVARRWKERSDCDGFRLDSAHLHPVPFWKRFVAELKSAPPR